MRIILILSALTYILSANSETKRVIKSKNPLPYFRRQVEEISDDIPTVRVTEDSRGKLLSLLVKNVKELFNEIPDESEQVTHTGASSSEALRPTISTLDADDLNLIANTKTGQTFHDDDLVTIEYTKTKAKVQTFRDDDLVTIQYTKVKPKLRANYVTTTEQTEEVTLNETETTLDQELEDVITTIEIIEVSSTPRYKKKETVKHLKSIEKSDVVIEDVTPLLTSISSYVLEATDLLEEIQDTRFKGLEEPNKTCIFCNNILTENCMDPKNKLVPSIMCERENDLCYSMHTPFGIIDRGCFNVNHNLTTYVCTCNLCNYISISEMPFIFSNKEDWLEDVIELSRTRNFRKSVFKDMACLRCEVNTTIKTDNMVDSANCLEGNVVTLPIQDCKENEICAVKAVRSDGYIWRGCVRAPMYNYWWTLCDRDLCNYDPLVTLHDLTSL